MEQIDFKTSLERNWAETTAAICHFIKEQVDSLKAEGMAIGISGGLDSAVVAMLGVRALGPTGVKGIFLPERDTSPASARLARLLSETGNFSLTERDITPDLKVLGGYRGAVSSLARFKAVNRFTFWTLNCLLRTEPYSTTLEKTNINILNQAIAFYRLKHRLRMALIFQHAEQNNLLVAGCLNLTEYMTGFFVPFGDSAADFAPILGLYKRQVRRLAEYLGVPKPIIERQPSPDLLPGIDDETALNISYKKLDLVLHGLEQKMPTQKIASGSDTAVEAVEKIEQLIRLSERLRTPIPSPDLSNGAEKN
ncbi:MAG: NAD(+) synthase [Bacillota bacterium]|nr:NAD(+) synthase [Bacillota bacterium]